MSIEDSSPATPNKDAIEKTDVMAEPKPARSYSTAFPSSWVAADARQPSPSAENQFPELGLRNRNDHLQSRRLATASAFSKSVSTDVSRDYTQGWTPPPAPTSDQKFFSEPRHNDERFANARRTERDSALLRGIKHDTKAEQTRYAARAPTISPALSVGQQSSSTSSSFHGRDIPAKGPSLSPTYSVV